PLTFENVAEVAVAVGAEHLDAMRAHRVVGPQDHGVGAGRVKESRPAAMGFDLLAAAEQSRAAGPTLVDTPGLGVGVLAGERPLSAGLAQHRELLGGEFLAPLVVGELHLGGWRG